MTVPLVFLDTETNGLHFDRRPWEIAMIRREPNGKQRDLLIQITDIDLSNAEPQGLAISRFYDRHVAHGAGADRETVFREENRVAWDVHLMTRGAHLVGAVPNFDAETLAAMLRRHKLCPAWHYHLIDVEVLAAGWLAAHNLLGGIIADHNAWDEPDHHDVSLPWESDDLSRACGVEPPSESERHTAMGDALWVMRWYDAIMSKTDG